MTFTQVAAAKAKGWTPYYHDGNEVQRPDTEPVEEPTHTWDFTSWSAETVSNLKVNAATSKTEGWSDVEKKADAEAGGEPTDL